MNGKDGYQLHCNRLGKYVKFNTRNVCQEPNLNGVCDGCICDDWPLQNVERLELGSLHPSPILPSSNPQFKLH